MPNKYPPCPRVPHAWVSTGDIFPGLTPGNTLEAFSYNLNPSAADVCTHLLRFLVATTETDGY